MALLTAAHAVGAAAPVATTSGRGGFPCAHPQRAAVGQQRVAWAVTSRGGRQSVYPRAGGGAAPVSSRLPEEAVVGWEEAACLLQDRLELEPEAIETVLVKAFGWGAQGYWRQQKVEEVPSAAQVEAVLALLAGIGVDAPEDQRKVVSAFPEILGCELELLEGNLEVLRTKWFLKGSVLAGTVKRKPAVLGSTVDCEGSCTADCNRCWCRF